MSYLVDTNVLSELRKGSRCHPGVTAWFARVPAEEIFLSALTVGEIRKGIESRRRRDPASAEILEDWLEDLVAIYSDRILEIDQGIAEQWGRFNVPNPLPVVDSLLAATAHVRGLTLVTRNVVDIARTGVAYLNPFT